MEGTQTSSSLKRLGFGVGASFYLSNSRDGESIGYGGKKAKENERQNPGWCVVKRGERTYDWWIFEPVMLCVCSLFCVQIVDAGSPSFSGVSEAGSQVDSPDAKVF